jgi:hypothetical protein
MVMSDKSQNNREKRVKKSDIKLNSEDKELLRKAMISSLQENLTSRESNIKKDLKNLSTQVEEYLASFIILGYTFEGEPVQCISAHNQQEADSLVTLINKFFHNHIENEGNEQN